MASLGAMFLKPELGGTEMGAAVLSTCWVGTLSTGEGLEGRAGHQAHLATLRGEEISLLGPRKVRLGPQTLPEGTIITLLYG